jgi:hypothetical protein
MRVNWILMDQDRASEPEAGSCEHGNEASLSVKDGEILQQLERYYVLKKNSALRSWLFLNYASGLRR